MDFVASIQQEKWLEAAALRNGLYNNFSVLFQDAPTDEALNRLIDYSMKVVLEPDLFPAEKRFSEILVPLQAQRLENGIEELRKQVASEYAELFIGPRPPLAPYYESVYLGAPSRLFTDQTMKVREFYSRCGKRVQEYGRIPDDHLAYELELMADLSAKETELLEKGKLEEALGIAALEYEFLSEHLSVWIGLFLQRLTASNVSKFYEYLTAYLYEFVVSDRVYLANLTAKPEMDAPDENGCN